jgi:hypothetical protein
MTDFLSPPNPTSGAPPTPPTYPAPDQPPTLPHASPATPDPNPCPPQPHPPHEGCDLAELLNDPDLGLPRLDRPRRGRRLVPKDRPKNPTFTPQQRLLLLDTWQRRGLPAGDFAALVGISKHTRYTWKKKFDTQGPFCQVAECGTRLQARFVSRDPFEGGDPLVLAAGHRITRPGGHGARTEGPQDHRARTDQAAEEGETLQYGWDLLVSVERTGSTFPSCPGKRGPWPNLRLPG